MTTLSQFTNNYWTKLRNDWLLWWQGKLDRPLVVIEAFDVRSNFTYEHLYPNLFQFDSNLTPEQVLLQVEAVIQSVHWLGDAYPRWWLNFGPGILAAFLGSQVRYANGITWFKPILKEENLKTVSLSLDPENQYYQRVLSIFKAAVQRWEQLLTIGYPDLGGILDILASLRGVEKLLLDLVDTPQEVLRLCKEVADVWLQVFSQLNQLLETAKHGFSSWAPLWMPASGYMLQSDFSYMISPRMFKTFVLPTLITCCQAMQFPFYHLDGKGQLSHLKSLLEIEQLKGIQWIPGDGAPPAEDWLELLTEIRRHHKLCQVYVTPAGAQKIVRELGGQGFVLSLWEQDPNGHHRNLTLQEAEKALEMLQQEGIPV
jgi:hypothetical protein